MQQAQQPARPPSTRSPAFMLLLPPAAAHPAASPPPRHPPCPAFDCCPVHRRGPLSALTCILLNLPHQLALVVHARTRQVAPPPVEVHAVRLDHGAWWECGAGVESAAGWQAAHQATNHTNS